MKFTICRKAFAFILLIAFFALQSCSSSNEQRVKVGASGFYVVNEGGFGNGNTSVSFYDRKTDAVTNNVFAAKNGRPLGDQSQSMTIFENHGFIVVQNSAKIEVVNADDISSFASVINLPSPRYFIGISSTKGYVSDWGVDGVTGTVKVIDLKTYEVIKTIPTGKGANRMLKINDKVYVTNSGGYDRDNTVKIIDTNTDAVVSSITVGDNPNSIVKDKSGNIWVASSGYNDFVSPASSTKGSITKISSANQVIATFTVDKVSYYGPSNLDISPDGETLYYTYDNSIYSLASTATALSTTAFKAKSYYGLAVDPFNGNIIGCNAPNFSSAGSIDVYDKSGNLLNTYQVGIAPNGCAFK